MKKKRIIGFIVVIVIISLVFSHFQFGLFTRYNYFTAKFDRFNGNTQILVYGSPSQTEKEEYIIASQMGFQQKRVNDCTLSGPQLRGYQFYNTVMENYLNKKIGKDWNTIFDFKVDSLFREHRVDAIKEKALTIPEVAELDRALDSISNGKEHLYIWVLSQEKDKPNVRISRMFPDSSIAVYMYYNIDPYTLDAGRILY